MRIKVIDRSDGMIVTHIQDSEVGKVPDGIRNSSIELVEI